MAAVTVSEARQLLPAVNGDGLPVVVMSEEQKYLFDLKGWIALPGMLDEAELESIREHQMRFLYRPEELPEAERDNHGGPSQVLLDAPAVVGVLNEIVSHQPLAAEDCYGFRFDHTYTSHRQAGHDNFAPHGGGGLFNFSGDSHLYQMHPGRIHAGLVRVVWELNEVAAGEGGTLFLSGSHKSAFPRPEALSGRDSALWETYSCPAGSAVIFTEALCHTGTRWTNTKRDRLSLFTCYNTVNAKWGKGCPPPAAILGEGGSGLDKAVCRSDTAQVEASGHFGGRAAVATQTGCQDQAVRRAAAGAVEGTARVPGEGSLCGARAREPQAAVQATDAEIYRA